MQPRRVRMHAGGVRRTGIVMGGSCVGILGVQGRGLMGIVRGESILLVLLLLLLILLLLLLLLLLILLLLLLLVLLVQLPWLHRHGSGHGNRQPTSIRTCHPTVAIAGALVSHHQLPPRTAAAAICC